MVPRGRQGATWCQVGQVGPKKKVFKIAGWRLVVWGLVGGGWRLVAGSWWWAQRLGASLPSPARLIVASPASDDLRPPWAI